MIIFAEKFVQHDFSGFIMPYHTASLICEHKE